MADLQANFQSYRVVWKISDEFDSNTAFLRSHTFNVGDSQWTLEMCKQPSYRFALCGEDRKQILRTTYYLLSNDINKKLENVNKFLTGWFHHGITGEKLLVCAFDVACEATLRNSEHWLEGGTRKHTNTFKKMTQDRVSEIAEIIEKSFFDSLVSKEDLELKKLAELIEKAFSEEDLEFKKMEPSQNAELKEEITVTEAAAPAIEGIVSSTINCPSPACIIETSISSSICPSQAEKLLTHSVQCWKEKRFCDIQIQVLPGGHEIRAHKLVLFSGSTVWKKLLTDDQKLSVITVPDLEPETVEMLVKFIYDGYVPKPSKYTDQLLIAAATYGVDDLKDLCEQQLIAAITIEAAINMMILAHRYNAPSLFENTINFVHQNIALLKQRDEWKSLFFSYPELAMEMVNNLY